MGSSKKHKKNKSERREKYEEYSQQQDPKQLQRGLKLILKVGSNATPEYNATAHSPPTAAEAMMSPEPEEDVQMQTESGGDGGAASAAAGSSHHRHKKSKKKKKKKEKERERKHHKHHHKEKRHKSRDREKEKERNLIRQNNNEMDDDDEDENVNVNNELVTVANDDNESSQDGFSFMDEEQSQNILYYAGITTDNSPSSCPVSKPIKARKIDDSPVASPSTTTNTTISTAAASPTKPLPELIIPSPGAGGTGGLSSGAGGGHTPKTPQSQAGSESGREPRTCVLKLKQQKSPLNKLLDHLLRFLEKRDPHQFFAWPVTDDIAPGYSSIISKPMDFSTMRQKIDDHEYSALNEFTEDFRRMCENAIRYNHVDTVYHKAAKRLLQLGMKYLQPENLMRSLKPLSGYMRELTAKELGFEISASANDLLNYDHNQHANDSNNEDEDDEMGGAPPTPAQLEEEERKRLLRLENAPKTHFEPYVDDLTGEEILCQVQNAALKAKQRLKAKKNAHKMGFLRQHKDGSTTLNLLINEHNEGPERVVSIGDLVGKLQSGSTQLQVRQSDPRNIIKPVKPLNYGSFASFAPTFDSRFSTLSKEETQLVLQTYGDSSSAEYAESILQFTKDSNYGTHIANGLLDILTNGEHSKSLDELYNMQLQNHEQQEMEKCFQSRVPPEQSVKDIELEYEKYKNVRFDFKRLHSLHDDLGIDMSFLHQMETDMKQFELSRRMQEHLSNNLTLIEKLRVSQQERLSQPLPSHLGLVPQPGPEETLMAQQVQQQLTDMAKKLPPAAIADPHSLRKAMGMSYAGLPPLTPSNSGSSATIQLPELLQQPVAMPQAIDIDAHGTTVGGNGAGASAPTSGGDLENELREFLESGSGLHSSTLHPTDDGNNIVAQLLLN